MKDSDSGFVKVPCKIGDVVKKDIGGTGVDLVVTRDIKE